MIEKYLQIETLSIVFLGDFNPVIIQPSWLANKGLIRDEEATSAKIDIIHNEIVRFEIDTWLKFESTRNRCEFRTSKIPYFEPLKDLASSVFKILCETPIKALGLNFLYDLSLPNQKSYYDFGNKLAPLNIWDEIMKNPRLAQVEIVEEKSKDISFGSRRVKVSPSDSKIPFGITVNINNNFDFGKDEVYNPIDFLESHIKITSEESKDIVRHIFDKIGM